MTMTQAYSGSVQPYPNFDPKFDAEVLMKAIKSFGCGNDKGVINVICYRTNSQRQHIKLAYKTMYGKDLIQELVSELKGHLEDVIVALMTPPADYDASVLRQAMKKAGSSESVLIEVMCSRNSAHIKHIKEAYRRLYQRDLDQDLGSTNLGPIRQLLISLSTGGRDESLNVNPGKAKEDALLLHNTADANWGSEQSIFNIILASQNNAQLNALFQEYKVISGRELEESITMTKELRPGGDVGTGVVAVCKCIRNRPAYFAEKIYLSMKGSGADEETLVRCIVSRSEIDMVQIKNVFQTLYKKTLQSFIKEDCSAKYKDSLLALVQ